MVKKLQNSQERKRRDSRTTADAKPNSAYNMLVSQRLVSPTSKQPRSKVVKLLNEVLEQRFNFKTSKPIIPSLPKIEIQN